MDRQRRSGRQLLILGALLLACDGSLQAFVKRDVREDRGPLVTGSAQPGSALAWSADGSELFYLAQDDAASSSRLQAVRLDGTTRALDPAASPLSDTPLALAPGGGALYYRSASGLREAFAGAGIDLAEPATGALAPTPDGEGLVYEAAGGLRLLHLGTGAVQPLGCAAPIYGFDAPVERVACADPQNPDAVIVAADLASGAATTLADFRPAPIGLGAALRWSAGDPTLVFAEGEFLGYYDGNPHARTVVRTLDLAGGPAAGAIVVDLYASPEDTTLPGSIVLSPDGGALAFWERECVAGSSRDPCVRAEGRVVLVDRATGASRVLASGRGPSTPPAPFPGGPPAAIVTGPIAFSPDGHQAAYLYGPELHVRATGR